MNFEEDGLSSKYDADLKAGRKASVVDWRKDLKTGRDILSFKPNYENKNYPVPNGADDSTKATEQGIVYYLWLKMKKVPSQVSTTPITIRGMTVPICSKTRSKDAAKQFSNDYTGHQVCS